ncbi:MAG: Cas9 endonuclease PAM-interacting domain-containing protein, partial [Peptococcaceae bacterium]|nr:Cas9 endonuclease PAM-interacting domain-containing protein [Peptococcaceae bacterium]
RKTVLITRRSYMVHGGITGKATIWSKEKANPEAYLPVKSSDPRLSDVTKYGGVTAIANAAYALVEYEIKGKVVRSLEGVPIYLQAESKDDPVLAEYLWKKIQLENKKKTVDHLEVKLYPVRQRSLVRIDGYYYYLAGAAGDKIYLINAVPVYLEKKWVDYIKVLEKAISREAYGTEDNKARQVVTPEQNDALYTHLLGKFITGIFAQRKASIMETIASGQQTFGTLDAKDQCFILSQIINWMNTSTQTVDLTLIGGSKHAGMLTVGKKISNCNEAILIEQSVTGLYERRINLKSL